VKVLAVALSLLLLIGAGGYFFRHDLTSAVSDLLPLGKSDSVPVLMIEPRSYRLAVPARGELLGLKTTPVLTPRIRTGSLKISRLVDEGVIVREGQVIVQFDPTEAQLTVEQSANQLSSFGFRIEKTEEDSRGELSVLEMDRLAAEMERLYAEGQIRRDEEIFSRWEIQESLMSAALAEFRKATIEEQVGLRQSLSAADLRILGIERGKAVVEMELAMETLDSLSLVAPETGVLVHMRTGMNPLEVGSEVWPGQPLMEVASLDRFRARLQVPETDIAGLRSGLPVTVILDAFPDRAFEGRMMQVARIAKQIQRGDPRKYFECDVLLEVSPDEIEMLKPGMSLRAEVEVDRRDGAFVLPKSALQRKEDGWVVFLSREGEYVETPVEILGSDHGFHLVSGLEEGDRVCLQHPFEQQRLVLPDFSAPSAPARTERFVINIG
jgi:HlyD family secretion protein